MNEALLRMQPGKLAFSALTSVRTADSRSAPWKSLPLRTADVKFAFFKFSFLNLEPKRLRLERSFSVRPKRVKIVFLRVHLLGLFFIFDFDSLCRQEAYNAGNYNRIKLLNQTDLFTLNPPSKFHIPVF